MKHLPILARGLRAGFLLLMLALASSAHAQRRDSVGGVPPLREVSLDTVAVAPQAADIAGWLLLDKDIQLELGGAVQNLYNFKFDKADKQFRSLRRRYPNHPMAYFLLALSTWWKMMPSNINETRYDRQFLAYLDSAQTRGEALYKVDHHNYEACFFLSAAYGFEARLHAERHAWRKATVASRRSLDYLERSREANGLSPEFLFGEGLFNYYAIWIGEEYPWLRPVLFFFPKGNRQRGIDQLRQVGQTAFYTGTEAQYFLATIYNSDRERRPAQALPLVRSLSLRYPDNARFQNDYARLCFSMGQFTDCTTQSQAILSKYGVGQVGYEAYTCRAPAYMLGWMAEHGNRRQEAREAYNRCLVFCEQSGTTDYGYYLFAEAALARLADRDHDQVTARRLYRDVEQKLSKKDPVWAEARTWLRANR